MSKFSLGQTVMTIGIKSLLEENNASESDLLPLLNRHHNGDWGNLCDEDKELNDEALVIGERLFSTYKLFDEKIYIITERDRSATTFLLPDEY